MILNDSELKNSEEVLRQLKTSLSEVKNNSEGESYLRKIAINGYKSLISDVESEIQTYKLKYDQTDINRKYTRTLKDHIIKVLKDNKGKPLRVREIAERAKQNGWKCAAKETNTAIRTTLHGKLKGHVLPDGRRVVQAGEGLFSLSNSGHSRKKKSVRAVSKNNLTLRDHIVKVLVDNEGEPINTSEIAKRVKQNGWKTDSKETTTAIRTILHGRLKGHVLPDGRIITRSGRGIYKLSKKL